MTGVFLLAQAHRPLAREGEDVVPDHVVAAVVREEAGPVGHIHDVVFDDHLGRAFVGVDAPAPVAVVAHVMDVVAADRSARVLAQDVDGGVVAEQPCPVDVMDVIVLDPVVHRCGRPVAPGPAAGNAGVRQVEDVVVNDAIVTRVSHPHADAGRKDPAAIVDYAVAHCRGHGLAVRPPRERSQRRSPGSHPSSRDRSAHRPRPCRGRDRPGFACRDSPSGPRCRRARMPRPRTRTARSVRHVPRSPRRAP